MQPSSQNPPLISVVLPVKSPTPRFRHVRAQIASARLPVEVILVVNEALAGRVRPQHPRERILVEDRKGRGFPCVQGGRIARGDIILFLHADTLLPRHWDHTIRDALARPDVVGGAFSLSFDDRSPYLRFLILLSNLLFRLTGELWGDRAIFVRADCLRDCLPAMDVLIMEDVRLSHCMKRQGRVLMLKDRVNTSSSAFRRRGPLDQTLRILRCRMLYALGSDYERIWECYYPESA